MSAGRFTGQKLAPVVSTENRTDLQALADLIEAGTVTPVVEIVVAALEEAGCSVGDVVRTRCYLTAAEDWQEVGRAHGEVFADVRPANAMIVVTGFIDPRWKVEIEADAVLERSA